MGQPARAGTVQEPLHQGTQVIVRSPAGLVRGLRAEESPAPGHAAVVAHGQAGAHIVVAAEAVDDEVRLVQQRKKK